MASDLANLLKQVKLKKSDEPMRDLSDTKTGGYSTAEEIKDYEDRVLAVNTENWIEILKDVTFPSVMAPFTLEDAQLFMDVYSRLYLNKDASIAIDLDWREHLTDEARSQVNNVKERLDKAMSVYTETGYAFVKLSSRSAKDGPLVQKRFKVMYRDKLKAFKESERDDENVKITCLLQAAFDALRVKTSEDVIDMFIRSERVYQDLLLIAVNQKHRFKEHFIIRKFIDIDVDMEFRGFVFGGNLTALSQYNYLMYSKRLVDKHEEISNRIKDFYVSIVKPKLEQADEKFPQNFIVDFAVCSTSSNLTEIWVIEINPFLNTTDGAMFSWEKERDILEGKCGFQFRYVHKPKPGSLTMMPVSVRDLLKSV